MTKTINNDRWLTEHFQEIIDKYAGGYVFIGNGRVLYTDRDGSPGELVKRLKKDFPALVPLFFRVPYPHELVCALSLL